MDNKTSDTEGTIMEAEQNPETQEEETVDDHETAADDSDDSALTKDQDPEAHEEPDAEPAPDTEPDEEDRAEEAAAVTDDTEEEAAVADDTEEREDEPASLIDCDALPVDLRFEIARQSSTLGELSQLTVGSVVDLDKTPESVVDIYANGRLVGTAELVMVDGKVGVRIKSRR